MGLACVAAGYSRFRRDLRGVLARPVLPAGVELVAYRPADAGAVHHLISETYRHGGGRIGGFEDWRDALHGDAEYDPAAIFLARAADGCLVGAAQCWTSSYIKDLAVAAAMRRKSIGSALLQTAFRHFQAKGFAYLDLKVWDDNEGATAFYRAAGMDRVAA